MEFKEKTLVSAIEQEEKEKREQEEIKKRHGITDEDVVVVEKPLLSKFILKTVVIGGIKTAALILSVILAAIGIITLGYPTLRIEFFNILKETFNIIA